MDYIKAEQVGTARWRVLAIPFGGPFKGKDFDGEFFSPRTDIKPDWFRERPVLWHHARDERVKDAILGTQGELERDDDGWWADVWLDRSNRYWAQVDKLLAAGKVYGSSGSMPHLVRTDHKSGEILVWPHIEQTLTPTPVNPFARVVPVKAVDHFSLAGIELDPAIRGLLADIDSQAADLRNDLFTGGGSGNAGDLSADGGDEAMARLEAALDGLRASI